MNYLNSSKYQASLDAKANNCSAKILVVEDDEFCHLLIKEFLIQSNCELHFASDGEQAISLFYKEKFDLVLLDIQIPKIDGFKVAKRIRLKNPELPLIAITAYITPDNKKQFDKAGITNIIEKPISPEKLKEKIANALQ